MDHLVLRKPALKRAFVWSTKSHHFGGVFLCVKIRLSGQRFYFGSVMRNTSLLFPAFIAVLRDRECLAQSLCSGSIARSRASALECGDSISDRNLALLYCQYVSSRSSTQVILRARI
ncbi:hypothetical protein ACPOL_2251 [Acidisarcina polymorpha]|uniref:Uncharacterized protein n=1 Tax=Acidisarcina polymorpha TaxID=2211140 RepID=A0A2Z5FYT1_9BACT|nr:hypothetical protein ACPOL_2251 [Acidisarcina polymorpha]